MVPAAAVDETIAGIAAASGGGRHPHRRRQLVLHRRHPARQGAGAEGHSLRRCRHQRRRVGPGARLLHDDWRPASRGAAPRSDLQDAGSRRSATSIARRDARRSGGTSEEGYLHCGPNGGGHFVKMVHNGIEYGMMAAYAEGLNVIKSANVGKQKGEVGCRDHAAARSRALPVRLQSARCRRGVAAGKRDRLLVAGPDGFGADRRSRNWRSLPAACPIPARGAGPSRPLSTKACRRRY